MASNRRWRGQFRYRGSRRESAVAQLFSLGGLYFMPLFKFTTDKIVKRLRWVAVFAIFFDDFNTLLGQPSSFWRHPETADEFNRLTHFFISHGWMPYCLEQAAYAAGAFLLASILPRQCALVMLLALILGHFDGASSWLAHRWHFGTTGMVIYAILLAAVIVALVFPRPSEARPKA